MAQKLTADLLAERNELDAEARKLESRARTLRKKQSQIDDIAKAELTKAGRDSIRRAGYTLAYVDGRAVVRWRDEFVRVAGADAADELSQNATPSKRLQVTAPAK